VQLSRIPYDVIIALKSDAISKNIHRLARLTNRGPKSNDLERNESQKEDMRRNREDEGESQGLSRCSDY
jgi:hypothetical protein